MQFQVPQFIEVEDKIFGPLTFKQFLYVAGGAGMAFILYAFLPLYLAAIPIVIVGAFAIALAFFPYNNRPFITIVEAAFRYSLHHKLYLWEHNDTKVQVPTERKSTTPASAAMGMGIPLPKMSESKLSDLSWSLDIKEKIK
jgi:hypothetical protein